MSNELVRDSDDSNVSLSPCAELASENSVRVAKLLASSDKPVNRVPKLLASSDKPVNRSVITALISVKHRAVTGHAWPTLPLNPDKTRVEDDVRVG